MIKLKDIAFEVLSDNQDKDLRNENIRMQIATTIEEKYRNFMKEFAKEYLNKKAIENLSNRINSGIITGPSDVDLKKFKR